MGKAIGKLFGGGGGTDYAGIQLQQQQADEARKAALRSRISGLFDSDAAKASFAKEEEDLKKSLSGYYGEELGKRFSDSARQLKFSAADTGGIGGSAYADKMGDLNRDNSMGGTRIAEAVERALNSLRTSREGARTSAINLVNTGGGEEAISAATSGMQSAIKAAQSGQRERLFDDLFQNLAVGKLASDGNAKGANALAYLNRGKSGSYFPTTPTDSSRVVNY